MTLLAIILALVLDQLLGEAKRFHPLVGFGWLANTVERVLKKLGHVLAKAISRADEISPKYDCIAGVVGWLLLVPLIAFGLYWVFSPAVTAGEISALLVETLVLYFCIGGRSLAEHARTVLKPLSDGSVSNDSLARARQQLSRMVSRDTANLDKEGIAKATVESVLENASDAVLAPIFWFAVAGIPGVLVYRLANTLDAMWGYKNQYYRYFGWATARMDDVLNWLPARCCALSYAITGSWKTAIHCWQQQASLCDSPNAGPVMSSGAGAMEISLGGRAWYHGQETIKPMLGVGRAARCEDIEMAIQLVWRTTILWVGVIALVYMGLWS